MSGSWIITLVTGMALLASSFFLGVREILLRPKAADPFPNAPFWLCTMMFAYMVCIFLTATTLLFSLVHPTPVVVHPGFMVLALAMMAYKGGMLANVLNQWLPAPVRERLNRMERRLFTLARCGGVKGRALAALEAQGVTVVGPNEGVGALVEEVEKRRHKTPNLRVVAGRG